MPPTVDHRAEAQKRKLLQEIRLSLHKTDVFKLFFIFIFCAWIGWIFETTAVWVDTGELTNRGYLFVLQPLETYLPFLARIPLVGQMLLVLGLPIIEMYGFGALIIIVFFRHWEHRLITLFFVGFFLMTAFELLGSYFCTEILHKSYWDYSHAFMNFQGRICLSSSIAWGLLSVLGVKVFAPLIDKMYARAQTRRHYKEVCLFFMIYALLCAMVKYIIDPGITPY